MAPERGRRRLNALRLFLATAVGGLVAFLLARRLRRRREQVTEETSVAELSARLKQEAAEQEMRLRDRLRRKWFFARWSHPEKAGPVPHGGAAHQEGETPPEDAADVAEPAGGGEEDPRP
jgi:hypothetical protein